MTGGKAWRSVTVAATALMGNRFRIQTSQELSTGIIEQQIIALTGRNLCGPAAQEQACS